MLALPFFVLFEFLGPFIETLGYVAIILSVALGVVNLDFALTFFAVAILAGLLLSISAVLLEDLAFRRYGRLSELAGFWRTRCSRTSATARCSPRIAFAASFRTYAATRPGGLSGESASLQAPSTPLVDSATAD